MEEQVLVLPRLAIDSVFGVSDGLAVDVSCVIKPTELASLISSLQNEDADLCKLLNAEFKPRSEVEDDPSYVQLIPYILVTDGTHRSNAKILTYKRSKKSGESRLIGKKSVGIGGHINPQDNAGNAYLSAMRREFEEELGVSVESLKLYDGTTLSHIYGVIRDTKTPVNAVHVGIVHVVQLAEVPCFEFAECMAEPKFELLHQQVARDDYEDWSKLALSLLDTMPRHVPQTL